MRTLSIALGIAMLSTVAGPAHGGGATLTLLPASNLATDVLKDEFDRTFVLGGSIFGEGDIWLFESTDYSNPMFIGTGIPQSMTLVDFQFILSGTFRNVDDVEEAGRWADGWEGLGQFPTGGTCPSISSGYGITADGATLCGLGWKDGCSARAFKWTDATGMVEMDLAGSRGNRGSHISADGSTIVGFGRETLNRSPAAWNANDGSIRFFNPDIPGEFLGSTPDGGILVGTATGPAVLYTDCLGFGLIGTLGSDGSAEAYDISDDGTVIVGASGSTLGGWTAFVWEPGCGIESLQQRLIDEGATIPPGVVLEFATAVTADGRTIVGRALDPSIKGGFPFTAYVATLPERVPCPGDFNCDGSVGFADLTVLLNAWGPCACPGPITCRQDLTGDGSVGFADLTDVLNNWGPCP